MVTAPSSSNLARAVRRPRRTKLDTVIAAAREAGGRVHINSDGSIDLIFTADSVHGESAAMTQKRMEAAMGGGNGRRAG